MNRGLSVSGADDQVLRDNAIVIHKHTDTDRQAAGATDRQTERQTTA